MGTHHVNYFDVPRMTGCTHTASPDACPACEAGPTVAVPEGGTCTVAPAGKEEVSFGRAIVREFSVVEFSYFPNGSPHKRQRLQGDPQSMAARIDAAIREAVEAERERCAKLAERVEPSSKCRCSQCETIRSFARIIAADIRDPKKGL